MITTLRTTVRMDSGTYAVRAEYYRASAAARRETGEGDNLEIVSVTDATGAEIDDEEIAARESLALAECVSAESVTRVIYEALEGVS
jgi:hypothetical protein